MKTTERVIDVLKRHDPMNGHEPPPFDLNALRARAAAGEFRQPTRRRHARVTLVLFWRRHQPVRRRTRTGVLAAVLALFIVVPSAIAIAGPNTPGLNPAALARIDLPGAPWLNDLIAALPHTAQPPAGSVVYLRQQVWTIDTTATTREAAQRVIAQDIQTWRTGNLAGRQCVVTLAAQQPGRQRATGTSPADAPAPCGQHENPGVLNVPLADADGNPVTTPAADPHTLAVQLANEQPMAEGGQYLLRAVVQTFRFYALNRQQRIAALTLLATTPGLRYRGPATDRAGRTGIAFTISSGTYRSGLTEDLVIIDPGDGRLLDHEQIALSIPPRVLTPVPAVTSYILLLAADTIGTLPQNGV